MTPPEIAFWRKASQDIGLDIIAPFPMVLPGGKTVVFSALIKNFGPANGMIVNDDYEVLHPHIADIRGSGYGYSSHLGAEPDEYDRADIIEVLKDWGWSGPEDKKPDWL